MVISPVCQHCSSALIGLRRRANGPHSLIRKAAVEASLMPFPVQNPAAMDHWEVHIDCQFGPAKAPNFRMLYAQFAATAGQAQMQQFAPPPRPARDIWHKFDCQNILVMSHPLRSNSIHSPHPTKLKLVMQDSRL